MSQIYNNYALIIVNDYQGSSYHLPGVQKNRDTMIETVKKMGMNYEVLENETKTEVNKK